MDQDTNSYFSLLTDYGARYLGLSSVATRLQRVTAKTNFINQTA